MARTVRRQADRAELGPVLGPALLADGRVVDLQRLTAADGGDLRTFYGGLSRRSLFLRFMTPTPRLPEGTLAYLCQTGRLDREVLVARFDGCIVAEGRFHRVAGTSDAEVALVVTDAWQGRGIGRILSERLARLARLRGVDAFTGSMMAENEQARKLLGSSAPGAVQRIRLGELEFRTPLP